jgi:DNA repair protein RecO (recombination protein O)
MSRNAVYSALVLRSRPSGESNNEVSLLTAEEGIIKATVFGGPKSKLRSHAAPYNSGQVWIYRDPAKEYGKLSDFDVHSWRPGLRELYERTMAAAGVAETVLYTHGGGGDWGSALKLAVSTLDALENANEELCERLLVHFLWRWAHFLGLQPHIESCGSCGDRADGRPLWYSAREGAVLCGNCATEHDETEAALSPQTSSVPNNQLCPHKSSSVPNNQLCPQKSSSVPGLLQLNPGCRRWLSTAGQLDASLLNRYSMDNKSFHEAKSLTTAVLTAALGKRLASWDW